MSLRAQVRSDSEAQYKRMMETPIPKLVTSIALPAVIGTLITVIYNTADTYFVSQINKSASAAVGAVYAIMAIVQAFGFGLGVGAASLISRRLGEKKNSEADKYASSAFLAAVLIGCVITAVGLAFLGPILRLLGCTDTMMPYAIPYARFILIAAPINCATFVLNCTLRSEGFANLATIGISAGGILNIFLDMLFINTLNMETGGAAITIANKVYVLVRNISIGLGQGLQPVAGYNYGAGNKKRTWQAFVFTAKVGSVICIAFAVFSALFAEPVMWWFCDDADVARIGIETIYFSSIAMPLLGFSTYVNQLYQCLGFKLQATFLASCRQGIFFLPAVLLLPLALGCMGVEAAQPLADICTFAVSIPFIIVFYRKYICTNSENKA